MSTHSEIVDLISRKNSAYIQYNPNLAKAVGVMPAIVYAIVHEQLQYMLRDKTDSREAIIKNDGWFFYEQKHIADKAIIDRSSVSRHFQKLIDVGIFETKRSSDPGKRVALYRELNWEIDLFDHTIISSNPYISDQNYTKVRECTSGGVETAHTHPYNKTTYTKTNTRACAGKETPPKEKTISAPKAQNTDICPKFIELAAQWEPKLSKSNVTEKQILRAATTLQKLVVDFGFSFKELELGIEWAHNDRIGSGTFPGWYYKFSTLTGLCQRNTSSQTNSEDIKFQKIHNARLRSMQNNPEEIHNRRIEAIIRKFWDEPNDEDDVQRCIADVDWFQNKLENINLERASKNKFIWHEGEKFLTVVSFLIQDIEAQSKKTFRSIMQKYLEYLQYKLQDGTIDTLYPGHFSKTSDIFRQYLTEDYKTTGRKLVDWQKGDFDE